MEIIIVYVLENCKFADVRGLLSVVLYRNEAASAA